MLYLTSSNHLEPLADAFIRAVQEQCASGAIDALTPTCLLVPNPQVETFFRFYMARRTGIVANLQCHFLRDFLGLWLPQAPTPMRLLTREAMQGMLLGVLSGANQVFDDPVMQPVRAYLDAAGHQTDDRERRCFQLTAQIARVFDDYHLSRPEMLRVWSHGQPVCESGYAATEAWQRALWLALFRPDGERDRLASASGMRWVTLPELCEREDWAQAQLPEHIHVFGLSYVPRVFHALLARLARSAEVYVYTPYPVQPSRDDTTLPPLLRHWRRPGDEHHRLLGEAGVEAVVGEVEGQTPADQTVLTRLQHAIWQGVTPPIDSGSSTDSHLKILACSGMRREAEVIANEIWALMLQDDEPESGREPLRFHDIAVIVNTQERDAYQTHLAAAFKECHDIPYTMIDVPAAVESRFVEALTWLLALPFGAFTRQELLRLLSHPAFLSRLPDADTDQWLAWCNDLAIVHGADREAHRETYIQRDVYNWEQGRRRLMLGSFMSGATGMSGADRGETRSFQLGESAYLPQEYAQGQLANAASFAVIVRSLIEDARFCQTERLSLRDWAAFLSHLVTAYLDAPSEAEARYVSRCLHIVQALEDLNANGRPVSYRMAYEFIIAALEDLDGHHRGYLTGGVAISSFRPMRPVPFRVVFIAGMGEGVFPAADRHDPLDVRRAARQMGDVTPREQDEYMFLETVVSAQQRLYLSYVCRDAQTGETLQPASVVQELVAFAGEGVIPVLHHSMARHARDYFPDVLAPAAAPSTPLINVLPEARREAQTLALREDLQRFCDTHQRPFPSLETLKAELPPEPWQRLKQHLGYIDIDDGPCGQAALPDTMALPLSALLQFLYCPLQAWAQLRLGFRTEADDDVLTCEDEPFTTPWLVTARLLRDTFWDKLRRDAQEQTHVPFEPLYDAHVKHDELAGTLPTGLFFESERRKHLQVLAHWHANLRSPLLERMSDLTTVRFGQAETHTSTEELCAPIVLETELQDNGKAKSVRVELYGRLEAVSRTLPGSLTLVTAPKPREYDGVRGFMDAVVLAASGMAWERPFRTLVNTTDRMRTTAFSPLSQDEAAGYLRHLLEELFNSPHDYLLPVEAVLRSHRPRNKRSVVDLVQDMRRDPYARYRSRYGPVPFPERYAPPAEGEAARMVSSRFDLYFNKQLTA